MKLEDKLKILSNQYPTQHLEDMLIEEMSELTQAIIKLRRANGEGCDTDASVSECWYSLLEEFADVFICYNELTAKLSTLSHAHMKDIIDAKLDRQLMRLTTKHNNESKNKINK